MTAMVLLLAATACGPFHRLAASSTPAGTIPWLPLPANISERPVPTPQPEPVPPGTPACTAADLRGAAVGGNGAGGDNFVSFAFSGAGNVTCFLDGTPAVTLFDAGGKLLPFKTRAPFGPPEGAVGPALVSPSSTPQPNVALKYGEAGLTIDWISQPERCPGQAGVLPAGARIDIPAGGSLTLPVPARAAGYPCQGLGVSRFVSPPAPAAPPPEPQMPTATLKLTTGSAVAGKPFAYLVTLTNNTAETMDLASSCPNYEEEMFSAADGMPLGGKHFYMLNCNPAGSLAPKAQLTFQIIFPVPAGAAPGNYKLMFAMLVFNGFRTSAEHPVEVTAPA